MTQEEEKQDSRVGRWRTCCLPFDLCVRSRWMGLGIGLVFVVIFIVACFLLATPWSNLLFNNCDVLRGTSNGGRCAFSLVYIIGVPLVFCVYVLFMPVLLYRIGKQNEEKDDNSFYYQDEEEVE
jgi:hypothetical protein